MKTLMEGLSRLRVDIDVIKFSGPVFKDVDNRLASLHLVALGLTDATMFNAQGEVVQPSEVVYNKPVPDLPWPVPADYQRGNGHARFRREAVSETPRRRLRSRGHRGDDPAQPAFHGAGYRPARIF